MQLRAGRRSQQMIADLPRAACAVHGPARRQRRQRLHPPGSPHRRKRPAPASPLASALADRRSSVGRERRIEKHDVERSRRPSQERSASLTCTLPLVAAQPLQRLRRDDRPTCGSRSTNMTCAAPRDSASSPARRCQRTGRGSVRRRSSCCSQLNSVSRTRSGDGRIASSGGKIDARAAPAAADDPQAVCAGCDSCARARAFGLPSACGSWTRADA